MAGSTEPSRLDLQRQALADMLARFTADRDSLIAAVQACQERLSKLVGRLETDPMSEPVGATAPAPASPEEGRNEAMRVRLDLEMAIGHVRASAEQANERAEEALRRVKEMEMRLEELAVLLRQRR